jgi:NitT/TauT family transport system substrate-binding protein
MNTNRYAAFRGVLYVLILCAVLGQAAPLAAQTQKIRITHSSRSNTATPLYVGVSKGFFREEGLEVELIQANPRLGAMAVINGDVAFTATFLSTFRGILQGLPLKLVMVALKKGVYYLIVRPEIKDIQELKGKTLGVATLRGADHLVAEELMRSKGFNPAQVQPVSLGDTQVRAQALLSGVVDVVALSPPHDQIVQKMGGKVLAGPPELGVPASGLTTSDRLIKENPQTVKSALRALLKATRFMDVNRQETIQVMMKWVKQPAEIAARSYDVELRSLARDGQMSDADLESFIDRLGEKRRPLDEVRDFSFARQAFKELEAGK